MAEITDVNQKQADISKVLIAAIILMTIVFMTCTSFTENEGLYYIVIFFPVTTVLLGLYTFTYRGKAHLLSRMLFFVLLIVSILAVLALMYVMALGKAFQH